MKIFCSFLLTLCCCLDIFGQNTLDLEAFQYRYVGPNRGGRATAVAGVATQPNVFYMGATGGGVWKTEDYGIRWKNISDGFFDSPSIGDIQVYQKEPNILYVGTGSDGLRSNVITGKGMYKSMDAGATWKKIGLENTGHIGAVEIHPTNPDIVFVAAIGQAFAPNAERGVFRTKDGGNQWEQVLTISDTTGFADLEFLPGNPEVIFATAWRAERKPWTIISGGKENGIYKSTDGGDHWQKIGQELPTLMGKIDLAVSPANPNVLYALIEAPGKEGGLYRSNDQGQSFTQVSNKEGLTNRPFYYTNVEADPTDAEVVYVMATKYFKSKNGGKDWSNLSTPHGDHHDLWINPNNPLLQVQCNDGGANVTHNGGQSWSSQFNQATAEIYQVEVDNQYPFWLYGGQQDNYSTIAVPSLPPHGHQAAALGFVINTGGCETGPAVPNPDNPDRVYSNCKGKFSVYDKSTGQEQRYDVGAAYMYGHNPKNLIYRFQRVAPIHVSPHDSRVIYHASQFVHKTTDEGQSWEIISPDLTAFEADKQVKSGFPITHDITGEEFYSTIYSLRESPLQAGFIWVGANDGPVHVTQDGGQNWTEVTPAGLPAGGRVDAVEPSPHDAGKAYIAVLRYQLGDWKPYIYRTNDFGENWQCITTGIPDDYPVRVVREDPDREGLLYAGTEFGMFISFDDGLSWSAFQQNLPVTPITDIKIHRQHLVLSTMGRGFFILDNLSTLHQKIEQLDPTKPQLFQPANTIRYRYPNFSNTHALTPSPAYPRPSVIIDYYLPEATSPTLQLNILNAGGDVIRSFTNEEKTAPAQTQRDMATNEFFTTVSHALKASKGLHRFRWDLKHTGAWSEKKGRRFKNGPYAAPGRYTVQLILGDDQKLEQDFQLLLDPRVAAKGVSPNHLKEQEQLALRIRDLLSKARRKAGAIKQQLDNSEKISSGKKKKLEIIYDQLVRSKGAYTETKFINQVEYLLGIVLRADQLPGQDVYDRLNQLRQEYKEIID